jgi:hypothetical protein
MRLLIDADRRASADTIHRQFMAMCSPTASLVKFSAWLCNARQLPSSIVCNPSSGRATLEITRPETISITVSTNSAVLISTLIRVRVVREGSDRRVATIHRQERSTWISTGAQKEIPIHSWIGSPVMRGARSSRSAARRALSSQKTRGRRLRIPLVVSIRVEIRYDRSEVASERLIRGIDRFNLDFSPSEWNRRHSV